MRARWFSFRFTYRQIQPYLRLKATNRAIWIAVKQGNVGALAGFAKFMDVTKDEILVRVGYAMKPNRFRAAYVSIVIVSYV